MLAGQFITRSEPPLDPDLSESRAPAVLPRKAERVEVVSGPRVDAAVCVEPHGMLPVHGERESSSQPPVLLEISILHSIHRGAAPIEVRRTEGSPDSGAEGVDEASLQRRERGLGAPAAAEEVRVVGVERGSPRELE